jgi:hypothetical protein
MRLFAISFWLCFGAAWAFQSSDSFLTLEATRQPRGVLVQVRWDISLRDLEWRLDIDDNGDGMISWGELRKHEAEITRYAMERMRITADSKPCTEGPAVLKVDHHSDGAYAVLLFDVHCRKYPVTLLGIDYRLFFDTDAEHRAIARLKYDDSEQSAIFTGDQAVQTLPLLTSSPGKQFFAFLREGAWHLWIGLSQMLFLLLLLLPSVLAWDGRSFHPVDSLRRAARAEAQVVACAAWAMVAGLLIAALTGVHWPERLIESLVAATVLFAAVDNIHPVAKEQHPWAVGVLGLVHGLALAGVVMALEPQHGHFALALAGFTVGVLGGVAAIAAVFLPVGLLLRRTVFYRLFVLRSISVLAAMLAIGWLAERLLGIKLLPF